MITAAVLVLGTPSHARDLRYIARDRFHASGVACGGYAHLHVSGGEESLHDGGRRRSGRRRSGDKMMRTPPSASPGRARYHIVVLVRDRVGVRWEVRGDARGAPWVVRCPRGFVHPQSPPLCRIYHHPVAKLPAWVGSVGSRGPVRVRRGGEGGRNGPS